MNRIQRHLVPDSELRRQWGVPSPAGSNGIADEDVAGNNSDSWLDYEHQLCVEVPPTSFQMQLDRMRGQFGGMSASDRMMAAMSSFNDETTENHDGSATSTMSVSERLRAKLEQVFSSDNDPLMADLLSNDSFISDPYGVGGAMPPAKDWIAWAMDLAENYPNRTKMVTDELQNSCELNKHVLNKFESETREGYAGSRTYICALNYLLHDAFARCGLTLPPGINLKIAIDLRGGEPLYKAQMRSWRGYKMRVFGIVEMINESGMTSRGESSPPKIPPAKMLRPISSKVALTLKMNELNYPMESCSDDESDRYGFNEQRGHGFNEGRGSNFSTYDGYRNNFDNGLSFGRGFPKDSFSKDIDSYESGGNDSSSSSSDEQEEFDLYESDGTSSSTSSSDEQEARNPYRYPEGIQFYKDGGYSTANKCHGGVMVEASRDGKEYRSEAIPDIALRASEGNLVAVKKIVKAAANISAHEKRATVNKARMWLKLNYNETKYCELYDATPLAYACINGHHDVVQYLLEQGADPTLRGTMPPSWSVNARGAVHKLYGKIERGGFPYPESIAMRKCGTQCENLLFAVRPFWIPALYCGDSCYGNKRGSFNNLPTDIDTLRLTVRAVPGISERPSKKTCSLCCRKKSMNCFTSQIRSKCDHCIDIEDALQDQDQEADRADSEDEYCSDGYESGYSRAESCLYEGQSKYDNNEESEDYSKEAGENYQHDQSEYSEDISVEDEELLEYSGAESYADGDQSEYDNEEDKSGEDNEEGYEHSNPSISGQESLQSESSEIEKSSDEDRSDCSEDTCGINEGVQYYSANEESNEEDESENEIRLAPSAPHTFIFGRSSDNPGFVKPSPNVAPAFGGFSSPSFAFDGATSGGISFSGGNTFVFGRSSDNPGFMNPSTNSTSAFSGFSSPSSAFDGATFGGVSFSGSAKDATSTQPKHTVNRNKHNCK